MFERRYPAFESAPREMSNPDGDVDAGHAKIS
jgi:hypothetical protein